MEQYSQRSSALGLLVALSAPLPEETQRRMKARVLGGVVGFFLFVGYACLLAQLVSRRWSC